MLEKLELLIRKVCEPNEMPKLAIRFEIDKFNDQYRWVMYFFGDKKAGIAPVEVKGDTEQSIDDVAGLVFIHIENELILRAEGKQTPVWDEEISGQSPYEMVDWNQYSLDELANYLDNKYRFQSTGQALAIYKLVDFYRKNKNK